MKYFNCETVDSNSFVVRICNSILFETAPQSKHDNGHNTSDVEMEKPKAETDSISISIFENLINI